MTVLFCQPARLQKAFCDSFIFGRGSMRRWIRRLMISATISVVTYVVVAACLVAFGTAKPPSPLTRITAPFASIDVTTLPAIRHYRARDGAELAYRQYPGGNDRAAVLIHGSAGSSIDMHPLATLLQGQGYTVYVPDIRGHGENSPHGDVAYVGQLDDDMEDFMGALVKDHLTGTWTLVGFSSGGGFVLRVAAEKRIAGYFQHVVLLAPYLRYDAPSVRQAPPAEGPWSVVSIRRIIGLVMLDRLGIRAFDGLPVLAFAVPPDVNSVTRTYSWRMLLNFGAHNDYMADIRDLASSATVLVGTQDDLLLPDALRKEFQFARPDVVVHCMPGVDHSGLVTAPAALQAIVSVMMGRTAGEMPCD
jgi:pimeloyl-ACP methyl ester carboxylesterase